MAAGTPRSVARSSAVPRERRLTPYDEAVEATPEASASFNPPKRILPAPTMASSVAAVFAAWSGPMLYDFMTPVRALAVSSVVAVPPDIAANLAALLVMAMVSRVDIPVEAGW